MDLVKDLPFFAAGHQHAAERRVTAAVPLPGGQQNQNILVTVATGARYVVRLPGRDAAVKVVVCARARARAGVYMRACVFLYNICAHVCSCTTCTRTHTRTHTCTRTRTRTHTHAPTHTHPHTRTHTHTHIHTHTHTHTPTTSRLNDCSCECGQVCRE